MIDKSFVLAGRAVFTLELPVGYAEEQRLPSHYTFKVVRRDATDRWPESWFVSLLTGPDNEHDFTYMGLLNPKECYVRLTKASIYTEKSMPYRLLSRCFQRIWANEQEKMQQAGFYLHHEGKCGRCGRTLTVPESVETGIGPECAKIMGLERLERGVA